MDPSSEHSTPSYSYNRLNENTYSNTTFVIRPYFVTSIQTQRNTASDASAGENYVASSELYQSTNHRGNTNGKNNDDSQSYETPQKLLFLLFW